MWTLVLLTLSTHLGPTSYDFNNNNLGVGIEYTDNLTYGIYQYNNSYNKPSTMLSVSKQWEYIGFGVAVANGYSKSPNDVNGFLASPEVTFNLTDNVRVKTTYPFGALTNKYDVINLQLTFDF